MLTKIFNWLHNTTFYGDHISIPAAGYWIGSTRNEIIGHTNDSKLQYENMKAVLYMGIR